MDENKYKRTKKMKWKQINTRGQRKRNGRKSIQEDKEKKWIKINTRGQRKGKE